MGSPAIFTLFFLFSRGKNATMAFVAEACHIHSSGAEGDLPACLSPPLYSQGAGVGQPLPGYSGSQTSAEVPLPCPSSSDRCPLPASGTDLLLLLPPPAPVTCLLPPAALSSYFPHPTPSPGTLAPPTAPLTAPSSPTRLSLVSTHILPPGERKPAWFGVFTPGIPRAASSCHGLSAPCR